jgi:hypothetical protein
LPTIGPAGAARENAGHADDDEQSSQNDATHRVPLQDTGELSYESGKELAVRVIHAAPMRPWQ